jgi:hypothetical protein
MSQNYFSDQYQTTTTNGPLFFGVLDTMTAFNQAVITSNADNSIVNFDFIQFEKATTLPEPGTLSLLAFGLVVSLCLRRRKTM